ncbi:MAG: preprotein translocase subunit SecE [Candidatus Dormibacteraeota bacterium]|uniref:Protein translocase subunit SecE n=1 Tax=Candidatus Amunia macphersoniae TaxID=3127014 RepID=A0A934KPB5_9BACT|nr:preprotein translocase subunit SecE [Candidatus Dormibacteraeota bacterium]
MAKAVRGQPAKPRSPVGPPAGAGIDRNYFASVVDELRKVVWPTWNELGRMTGVVITTVILMAVIISAADYGLGLVVKQLYSSGGTSTAGSQVSAKPSIVSPGASKRPAPTVPRPPTTAGGVPAPATP